MCTMYTLGWYQQNSDATSGTGCYAIGVQLILESCCGCHVNTAWWTKLYGCYFAFLVEIGEAFKWDVKTVAILGSFMLQKKLFEMCCASVVLLPLQSSIDESDVEEAESNTIYHVQ